MNFNRILKNIFKNKKKYIFNFNPKYFGMKEWCGTHILLVLKKQGELITLVLEWKMISHFSP